MNTTRNDFTKGKTRAHERLDVEDDERRQQRMRMWPAVYAFSHMLTHSSPADDMFAHLESKSPPHARDVPRSFDFGDRRTFMVEPPTERVCFSRSFPLSERPPLTRNKVLSRIQAFLPEFAASTVEITRRAQENPDSVDIEKLNNKAHYIKMVRHRISSYGSGLTRLIGPRSRSI